MDFAAIIKLLLRAGLDDLLIRFVATLLDELADATKGDPTEKDKRAGRALDRAIIETSKSRASK